MQLLRASRRCALYREPIAFEHDNRARKRAAKWTRRTRKRGPKRRVERFKLAELDLAFITALCDRPPQEPHGDLFRQSTKAGSIECERARATGLQQIGEGCIDGLLD